MADSFLDRLAAQHANAPITDPVQLEQRILDIARRVEAAANMEAAAVAAWHQANADYQAMYTAALLTSDKRSADLRAADAEQRCADAGLTARLTETLIAHKSLKTLAHGLRSAQSGYQSALKSANAALGAGDGTGGAPALGRSR